MEFIFRTLVEMKMDLEDIRSEFERYRGRHPELLGDLPLIDLDVEPIEISADTAAGTVPLHADPAPTIRLTPDMTMDDVEREAIRIALEEMRGNRRKAGRAGCLASTRAVNSRIASATWALGDCVGLSPHRSFRARTRPT